MKCFITDFNILHGNELEGGARYPPASHLILLFATLLTLASRLVFSVAEVVVVVVVCGCGGVRVPAGWCGCGCGHVHGGVCRRVCLPEMRLKTYQM